MNSAKRIILVSGCLFFCLFSVYSADDLSAFRQSTDSLEKWFRQFKPQHSIATKHQANQKIIRTLKRMLRSPASFTHPFDSVQKLGKVMSPDSLFRIYTWNIPLKNGHHEYHGFIQKRKAVADSVRIFRLSDASSGKDSIESATYDYKDWYGMLYYEIIPVEKNGQTYYTLLGLDFHDRFISQKIVDVLFFDAEGTPVFGAPLFRTGKQTKNRRVFQFSSEVVMTMNYNKQRELIIMDRLVSSKPQYEGHPEYYGPSGLYDALRFKQGYWRLEEDISLEAPRKQQQADTFTLPDGTRVPVKE